MGVLILSTSAMVVVEDPDAKASLDQVFPSPAVGYPKRCWRSTASPWPLRAERDPGSIVKLDRGTSYP